MGELVCLCPEALRAWQSHLLAVDPRGFHLIIKYSQQQLPLTWQEPVVIEHMVVEGAQGDEILAM